MERRKRENHRVLFDYRDLIGPPTKFAGKKLIKMKKGPLTYTTELGTCFFKDHPFKWVDREEADFLLGLPEEGYVFFMKASKEEVEDYYAL
jgi:hypothetical protein